MRRHTTGRLLTISALAMAAVIPATDTAMAACACTGGTAGSGGTAAATNTPAAKNGKLPLTGFGLESIAALGAALVGLGIMVTLRAPRLARAHEQA